jgi:hypothetical protein
VCVGFRTIKNDSIVEGYGRFKFTKTYTQLTIQKVWLERVHDFLVLVVSQGLKLWCGHARPEVSGEIFDPNIFVCTKW